MAFENYPETNEPVQNTGVVTPVKRNNLRAILTGALVVALLGTWGYIIYDKNQTKQTIEQKETMIATTSTQRDQLQKELEDAAAATMCLKRLIPKKTAQSLLKTGTLRKRKSGSNNC